MRYERQEVLERIGKDGQAKLSEASVAVIGLGSTGSLTAEILARAGVGRILIIDHDSVEEHNLTRQFLYSEKDIGEHKATAAEHRLRSINSEVSVEGVVEHVTHDTVDVLEGVDVVLDCTDNLYTRFLINDYCLKNGVPWIYAAAVEDRGLVYVTDGKPCFNCVFGNLRSSETCQDVGILGSAASMASSVQATEALKLLLGEERCAGLVRFNTWKNEFDVLKVSADSDCKACKGKYEYLNPASDFRVRHCQTTDGLVATPLKSVELDLERIEGADVSGSTASAVVDGVNVLIHRNGDMVFDEKNKDRVEKLTSKLYEQLKPKL